MRRRRRRRRIVRARSSWSGCEASRKPGRFFDLSEIWKYARAGSDSVTACDMLIVGEELF